MNGAKPKFWLVGTDADHARLNGVRTLFARTWWNFGFVLLRWAR
jgi:hypothetical protein